MRSERVSLALVLAVIAACTGNVGAPGQPGTPTPATPTGEAPPRPPVTTPAPGDVAPPAVDPTGTPPPVTMTAKPSGAVALPLAMARLTKSEYANAIRDVLGAAAAAGFELEEDYLLAGSAAAGAREVTVSRTAVRGYTAAAEVAADRAVADPLFRQRFMACGATAVDAACARTIVADIGRRLHRRPLATDEVERWVKVATTAGGVEKDFWKGLRWALAGLLASPSFTHRIEIGRIAGDTVVPTAHELAARLSFLLWDSVPDDELTMAAASGELDGPAGYERQVDRLLANRARVAAGLHALAADLFVLHEIEAVTKDPMRFPGDGPELRASMRGAAERLLEETAATGADLLSVFEPGFAFTDKRLAPLLGLSSTSSTLAKVALSKTGARVGLLTEPALLAIHARDTLTSPTLRGRFIRETLLCYPVPDAPADVDNSLPNTANGRTRREQLSDHMKNPACSACHKLMDPLGFALEGFDALGAVQTTDNGAPIVTTGELDGKPFDGARGLSRLMREHERTGPCMVRGVFRHVVGAFSEGQHGATVEALASSFAGGGRKLLPLLRELALSPAFRAAAPPL